MADLKSLFVLVPAGTIGEGTGKKSVDDFITLSNQSSKIYFLADTNQIVAKGVAYGTNSTAYAALKAIVDRLDGADTVDGSLAKAIKDLKGTATSTGDTLGKLEGRLQSLETLLSNNGDDNDIIDRISEVITWFAGVEETETGAQLISDVAALKSGNITIEENYETGSEAGVSATVTTENGSVKSVGVTVTPGSVEANNTSVVTGGTVHTAIEGAKTILVGQASDTKDSATITGAKKYADDAVAAVQGETSSTVKDVVDAIGTDTTANSVKGRIKTLETTVGNSSSGLVKDVADLKAKQHVTSDVSATVGKYISGVHVAANGALTIDETDLPELSVKTGSANYVEVDDHAVGVKTTALGDVNLVYNESAKTWSAPTTAPDSLTGLATAADVAAEIVANEQVVAAALNDHEDRIAALEQVNSTRDLTSTATATDSDASEFVSATVTIAQDADGKLTNKGSSVDVDLTTATYTAATNTITDGLVTASTLKAVLEDMWETYSATTQG